MKGKVCLMSHNGADVSGGPVTRYRTRDGVWVHVEQETLARLRKLAMEGTSGRNALGASFAIILGVSLIIAQVAVPGGTLVLGDGAVMSRGLGVESFLTSSWDLVLCLFVHRDVTHLALMAGGVLLFGVPLGWKHGWLVVATSFLFGGIAAALAGLPAVLAKGGTHFVGADGGVLALLAASVLSAPRWADKDGWFPFNLLLAYGFLASWAAWLGFFQPGGHFPVAMLLATLPGMMVVVVLSDLSARNDLRFSAVFLCVALFFFYRLLSNIAGLVRGDESLSAVGPWIRLAVDLLFVLVGSFYVMVQAEVVRDREKFAYQQKLDELVRSTVGSRPASTSERSER